MKRSSRRDFLKQSLAAASSLPLLHRPLHAQVAPQHIPATGPELERFVDPLPLLSRLAPTAHSKQKLRYRMRMTEFTQRLHSALPPTRLWGYEGLYPGPVIEANRGQAVEVLWENHLPQHHLFAIDPRIHGSMPPAPEVRTVPHLHGSRTSPINDGLPEKWFTPGKSVRYLYPNDQRAATLWYHDHAVGITRLNVYAGLSGMYLLRDEDERSLGLPTGDYEVPLILQDKSVDAQGRLLYTPTHDDGLPLPPGTWGPEFFGTFPVVNGVIYPHLDVETRCYRFRLLNGSNSRFLHLYLNLASKATDIPDYIAFQQIGSDGGLLSQPVQLNNLLLGPAERVDLLVDFSAHDGKIVTLVNDGSAPFPGWSNMVMHAPPIYEMMQFRVRKPRGTNATTFDLRRLKPIPRYKEADAVKQRDLILVERTDADGKSLGVRINEKGYDDPVTETPKLGTMEKWRFVNTTEDAHPMHLHLVQFQVLERQGFDAVALEGGVVKPIGTPRPAPAQESGWKDTAVVMPGEMLTILVRFEGFTGKYVYHCHMLEHEDNDMMRPFEVMA